MAVSFRHRMLHQRTDTDINNNTISDNRDNDKNDNDKHDTYHKQEIVVGSSDI